MLREKNTSHWGNEPLEAEVEKSFRSGARGLPIEGGERMSTKRTSRRNQENVWLKGRHN